MCSITLLCHAIIKKPRIKILNKGETQVTERRHDSGQCNAQWRQFAQLWTNLKREVYWAGWHAPVLPAVLAPGSLSPSLLKSKINETNKNFVVLLCVYGDSGRVGSAIILFYFAGSGFLFLHPDSGIAYLQIWKKTKMYEPTIGTGIQYFWINKKTKLKLGFLHEYIF